MVISEKSLLVENACILFEISASDDTAIKPPLIFSLISSSDTKASEAVSVNSENREVPADEYNDALLILSASTSKLSNHFSISTTQYVPNSSTSVYTILLDKSNFVSIGKSIFISSKYLNILKRLILVNSGLFPSVPSSLLKKFSFI